MKPRIHPATYWILAAGTYALWGFIIIRIVQGLCS